jgi:hypothetical protein
MLHLCNVANRPTAPRKIAGCFVSRHLPEAKRTKYVEETLPSLQGAFGIHLLLFEFGLRLLFASEPADESHVRAMVADLRSALQTTVRAFTFGVATAFFRLSRLLPRNVLMPEVNLKIAFMTAAPFQVHEIIVESVWDH